MEERSLDIEMLDIPTKSHRKVKNGMEQFKTCGGGSCLGEVDTRLLSKSLCYIPYLVSSHLACIVPLSLADKFTLKQVPIAWN